ncbi:hypothetical protein [Tomitella fengzijianii]|uniref:Uncharacterized protein n=1 Tax=Tomitella fengzijianii TaxID=2597660 RepID=A0A516X648_9ACTN|nr:hypothetical protein [Tomitella fengzijianii]QDQ98538.1 hypothetical protein FO059_15945 [Tomitella fengzijianii]
MANTDKTATVIDGSVDSDGNVAGRIVSVVKQAGLYGVDTYEKSLERGFGFQKKIAGITGVKPFGALVETQEKVVMGVSGAATNVLRGVLS